MNQILIDVKGLSGETVNVAKVVKTALDVGYRHIDTAYSYQNEKEIGAALQETLGRGITRQQLFVTTKLPNNGHRRENVTRFMKKSLERLQLDYVDLYLMHTPFALKGSNDDDCFPSTGSQLIQEEGVGLEETWKGMEDVVDAGLAKAIGLSNVNSQQIARVVQDCKIKPAALQVECHIYLPQQKLLEFCKDLDIAVIAYAPLGSPSLVEIAKNQYGIDLPSPLKNKEICDLAVKYDKSPAQILLRWLIERGVAVIPKSSNEDRMRENLKIFDFSLADEDRKLIDSIQTEVRYYFSQYPLGITDHPEYPFNIPF